jgi:hypothetical protein
MQYAMLALHYVMAGLIPAIHVLNLKEEVVDARHKAGHDAQGANVGSTKAQNAPGPRVDL